MSLDEKFHDDMGDNHIASSDATPLRSDAFDRTDEEKIELIKKDVENILNIFYVFFLLTTCKSKYTY